MALEALSSVACVLRDAAPHLEALPHVALLLTSFLDVSSLLSLEKAAEYGSLRMFRRVLTRLQQCDPPIHDCLMESYLSKALTAAVERGHLHIAMHIHDLHPGKLHASLLPIAAENGDIPMAQWLLENRQDERCVPCLHERDPEIEVLEDTPRCCLRATFSNAVNQDEFAVIRWMVDNGYEGPGYYLRNAGESAARIGDLDTVKWLHERNLLHTFSALAIDEAARGGYLDIVAFLLTNRSEGWTEMAQQYARFGRYDDVLQLLQSPEHRHLRRGLAMTRDRWLWEAARAGRFDLIRESMTTDPSLSAMEVAMAYACQQGSLENVQWMVEMDAAAVTNSSLHHAAQHGHLDILKWIRDQGIGDFDVSISDTAAQLGHLDILQWLHDQGIGGFASRAMNAAAVAGHLAVVEWLHSNRTEGCTRVAMDGAASAGHLHIVQWLHTHRAEGCTVKAMDSAAQNGHLHVVKWLHEHRIEGCTTAAMDGAAKNGDLEMVIWLHENRTEGCTRSAMNEAPLYVVKWLHFNREEGCTTAAMDLAAQNGDLPKLQFLHAHRTEGCSISACLNATTRGHLYVLQWLRHHRPQDFDPVRISYAAHAMEKTHIVTWLQLL